MRAPPGKRSTDEIVAEIISIVGYPPIEMLVRRRIADLQQPLPPFAGNRRQNVEYAKDLRRQITKLERMLRASRSQLLGDRFWSLAGTLGSGVEFNPQVRGVHCTAIPAHRAGHSGAGYDSRPVRPDHRAQADWNARQCQIPANPGGNCEPRNPRRCRQPHRGRIAVELRAHQQVRQSRQPVLRSRHQQIRRGLGVDLSGTPASLDVKLKYFAFRTKAKALGTL